jgi:hypothetical protein
MEADQRWYAMGEWLLFKLVLPFGLPLLATWILVSNLGTDLISPSSSGALNQTPNWSLFWRSPKILLVGLLVTAGTIKDFWDIRARAPSQSTHSLFFCVTILIGSYAGLKFAALGTRQVLGLGPLGNFPLVSLVITVILVGVAGCVHWLRITIDISEAEGSRS